MFLEGVHFPNIRSLEGYYYWGTFCDPENLEKKYPPFLIGVQPGTSIPLSKILSSMARLLICIFICSFFISSL